MHHLTNIFNEEVRQFMLSERKYAGLSYLPPFDIQKHTYRTFLIEQMVKKVSLTTRSSIKNMILTNKELWKTFFTKSELEKIYKTNYYTTTNNIISKL